MKGAIKHKTVIQKVENPQENSEQMISPTNQQNELNDHQPCDDPVKEVEEIEHLKELENQTGSYSSDLSFNKEIME